MGYKEQFPGKRKRLTLRRFLLHRVAEPLVPGRLAQQINRNDDHRHQQHRDPFGNRQARPCAAPRRRR